MAIGMTVGPITKDQITEEMVVIKGIAIGTKIMAVGLGIEMEGIDAASRESSQSRSSSQNRYESRRLSRGNNRNRDRSEV